MEPITGIIGRNLRSVEGKLGEAHKVEQLQERGSSHHVKACYQNGEIEVVFIDNVADWITIYNKQNRSIENFVSFFGLTDLNVSFNYWGKVRYSNMSGFREVSYDNNATNSIKVIYIKAFTI